MGAVMMKGFKVAVGWKFPTATHCQSVTHDTPARLVRNGTFPDAFGVFGTVDHEVPFQTRTSVESAMVGVSAVPTAVHEVALKQSTPARP